jgi:TonB family protein
VSLALSLCGALVFVGAFAVFAINAYFEAPPINQVVAFEVATATAAELAAVRRQERPSPPEPPPSPTLEVLEPKDGFVQVEFEVTPQGRAVNARIVGAVPAGYYEKQALRRIQSARYVPDRIDGRAVSTVRSQIVEFTYPSVAPTVP